MRRTIVLLLMLAMLPAVPALGQRHRSRNDDGGGGGEAFPAKAALDAQQSKLETDLAAMLEQQAQGPSPVLGFQIDMHILARWLTEQAAGASPRSPLQASAFLRATEVLNCGTMLSAKLNAAPITAAQAEGLAKLHKLTFKLPDITEVGKLDDFCKDLAIDLIAANGPLPPGMHDVPLMRPKPIADHQGPAVAPAAAPPKTLAQLVDDANHAAVSPALHAQLAALATAATTAAIDPKSAEEAATLSAMLQQVMDLVTGLQTNVGVAPDDRAKMEQSLTDGVALFADPRMRTAGRRRIESLDQYRQNLDRIRKLHLSPELSAKFAPAFVYADQNPDTGNDVMESIQKWVALTAEFDHHTSPPGLTSNQTRIVDAMQKRFATEREAFLTDADNLAPATPAAGAGSATFSVSPADLAAHLPKMQDAIHTTQLIERATIAVTALLPYHPRPTGGLERRVNVALGTLADDVRLTPDRMTQREQDRQQDALRFLGVLERLAQTAADVSTSSNGIPDSVAQNWTGGKLGEFDAKRTDLVGALASQAASERDIDTATLDRLDRAKALVAGLHDAAAVQAALDQMQPLSRWVDWTIAPADLQTVLGPVRDASTAAIAGFINDDDDALHNWPGIHEHYAPLMNLIASAGAYVDQCNVLPGDVIGEMAKLATPMDGEPFADERYASLCIGVWSMYNQAQIPDQPDADAMVQALLKMGK